MRRPSVRRFVRTTFVRSPFHWRASFTLLALLSLTHSLRIKAASLLLRRRRRMDSRSRARFNYVVVVKGNTTAASENSLEDSASKQGKHTQAHSLTHPPGQTTTSLAHSYRCPPDNVDWSLGGKKQRGETASSSSSSSSTVVGKGRDNATHITEHRIALTMALLTPSIHFILLDWPKKQGSEMDGLHA